MHNIAISHIELKAAHTGWTKATNSGQHYQHPRRTIWIISLQDPNWEPFTSVATSYLIPQLSICMCFGLFANFFGCEIYKD
jgi:hypothetical protein